MPVAYTHTPLSQAQLNTCAAWEQQGGAGWSLTTLHHAHQTSQHWSLFANGQWCGYLFWQTVLDEAELHNITIAPEFRRNGHALASLRQWLTHLQQQSIARVLLEVRASNRPALQLYHRLGFNHDGMRKAYYACPNGQREDALLLSCWLKGQTV